MPYPGLHKMCHERNDLDAALLACLFNQWGKLSTPNPPPVMKIHLMCDGNDTYELQHTSGGGIVLVTN